MLFFLAVLLLLAAAQAIVPEARIINNDEVSGHASHSLPNLLKLENAADLHGDWDLREAMALELGRLVVSAGAGSIWARTPIPTSRDEWTIDVVFRNLETADTNDHSFYDTNGFSFWLLDLGATADASNFGGPSQYDGLQFLVNNKGSRGLKIFASDALRSFVNSADAAVGGCAIGYLDSMIPFTLRVSYSSARNWFKVQIDNNVCFSTDAISFANLRNGLLMGVSALTNPVSKEYWELLGLTFTPQLTEDAIDDHGVAQSNPFKYVTVTQARLQPTGIQRLSLMDRQRQSAPDFSKIEASLLDVAAKLAVLESGLGQIGGDKLANLALVLANVKQIQDEQLAVLHDLRSTSGGFEALLTSHYKELTDSFAAQNRDLIEEVKRHRRELSGIGLKVDLLMSNHEEIQGQFNSEESRESQKELFNTIVRWILIPLIIGIVAVIVVVHRLKKDIKHSKLL